MANDPSVSEVLLRLFPTTGLEASFEQKAKLREIAGPPFEGEIVFEEPASSNDK
jgi:hypothetical protein